MAVGLEWPGHRVIRWLMRRDAQPLDLPFHGLRRGGKQVDLFCALLEVLDETRLKGGQGLQIAVEHLDHVSGGGLGLGRRQDVAIEMIDE